MDNFTYVVSLILVCVCVSVCSGHQWSVLVQDNAGVLCEIILPRHCLTSPVWSSLVSSSPGQLWTFTGLSVNRRFSRFRFQSVLCYTTVCV